MLTDSERAALNDPEYHECMAWNLEYRAETLAKEAARAQGGAKGHLFRAEELRYDARGGMTEAQAARRFEPGARWSVGGEECEIVSRDESGLRVDSQPWQDGMFVRASEMTRENGWLLLAVAPVAEEQARAATEAQAIKRELANFVRAATDAGIPVLVWSPEASEAQGETWDEPRKGDG